MNPSGRIVQPEEVGERVVELATVGSGEESGSGVVIDAVMV